MYLDVPSLLGAYMELRNLRRFGGAQRSDADQVRQHKRFADKNVYLLRKKKRFKMLSGKYKVQECLFLIFLKERKMQICNDLVFLWGEILHLESPGS